ncbi:hypothetical protein BRADI_1g61960v3 [Brachypodium distachyon]|uniref:Uncharacterized protein n=2 Tax=Brachypodium distachyon TaxID=15368 RepID=A0A0Q3KB27_BRADI|nr:hypothetical protein BRADI_1g61960v3 [Brachypodium distachyon]
MQVYEGFPIATNKVTEEERGGVPHHLLGVLHPDADFTAEDFRREAQKAISGVLSAGRVPVVAGGSNTYIVALVEGEGGAFRKAHDSLFLWLDAAPSMLEWYAGLRVGEMMRRGLVIEARNAFRGADADYTRGVRRAIGLPELHAYLQAERDMGGPLSVPSAMLQRAASEIKASTFALIRSQTTKIRRLSGRDGWDVRRIDVTPVFSATAQGVGVRDTWDNFVWGPCQDLLRVFLGPVAVGTVPGTTAAAAAVSAAPAADDAAGTEVLKFHLPAVTAAFSPSLPVVEEEKNYKQEKAVNAAFSPALPVAEEKFNNNDNKAADVEMLENEPSGGAANGDGGNASVDGADVPAPAAAEAASATKL